MESRLNEPTTGEIVRALRYCTDVNSICGDACPAHLDEAGCRTVLMENAADRLESQEREIEQLNRTNDGMIDMMGQMTDRIKELTARAESAERERDDIEKSLARRIMKYLGDNEFDSTFVCEICEYNLMHSPKCLSCGSDHHYGENFELKHALRG